MNNKDKARQLAIQSTKDVDDNGNEVYNAFVEAALLEMAQWKDEQFKEQLSSLKDEIQNNLCASSGFNDEYSHGYQDCGMKVIEMIDKILES